MDCTFAYSVKLTHLKKVGQAPYLSRQKGETCGLLPQSREYSQTESHHHSIYTYLPFFLIL